MFDDKPEISTAIIAFVFFEIFFLIDSRSILNVFSSISAKTGIQFQCKMALAHADIVQVGNITSSPGFKSKAPKAHIKPVDHEFTEIAYLTFLKTQRIFFPSG